MKRKWKILFALLAAAALVLAAGCSDDSSDAWDDVSQDSANSGASSSPIEITENDVAGLLKRIGNVKGNASDKTCYWDFASGTLDTDDGEAYTFAVEWNNSSISPTTATTLSSIKEVGNVSTSLLTLDLSDAEWAEKPASTGATSKTTTGTVVADIELANGASGSYTLPESLQSVTIELESSSWIVQND